MKKVIFFLLILTIISGCTSATGKSITSFGSALGHALKLKQGTALSPSLSEFGVGFGILEGLIWGIGAIKEAERRNVIYGSDSATITDDTEVPSSSVEDSPVDSQGAIISPSDETVELLTSQDAEEGKETKAESSDSRKEDIIATGDTETGNNR